jgi:isopentenyl phosphate kinase
MTELVFLKLGGSLITDKTRPFTPRLQLLDDLAVQIASVLSQRQDLKLILGHGSGSFGHTPAVQHGTRAGVRTPAEWRGFCEVWWQASALNRHVMEALRKTGLPALALSPLAGVTVRDGQISSWDLNALTSALSAGVLPVIHGDVVFDELRGGTILSTEDLFAHLAHSLHPARILLAGLEPAVWADFPARRRRIEKITRESFQEISRNIGSAQGADVTGGMRAKVLEMFNLVQEVPALSVQIFSGEQPGNLQRALLGEQLGTLIAG